MTSEATYKWKALELQAELKRREMVIARKEMVKERYVEREAIRQTARDKLSAYYKKTEKQKRRAAPLPEGIFEVAGY